MDLEKRKTLEAAGWRFGDADDFLARTQEQPQAVKAWKRSWVRLALILVVVPMSLFAGVTGAWLGMRTELHGPLSRPNFDQMKIFGSWFGIFGAVVTSLLLMMARRERLWWIAVLGVGITLFASGLSCGGASFSLWVSFYEELT